MHPLLKGHCNLNIVSSTQNASFSPIDLKIFPLPLVLSSLFVKYLSCVGSTELSKLALAKGKGVGGPNG